MDSFIASEDSSMSSGVPAFFFTAGVPLTDEESRTRDIARVAYLPENARPTALGAYRYDSGLSDKRTVVYATPNKSYLGFRGTDVNSASDLEEDAYIATGQQRARPQYQTAPDKYDAVAAKYNNSIVVSGHSSGGNRAAYTSQKRNARAHTFNTGRGLDTQDMDDMTTCQRANAPAWCNALTRHIVEGDLLSKRDRLGYGKVKVYDKQKPGVLDNHSILAFY